MHKEYAVEPAAIGQSWDSFRYLIEKFGFSEGRVISRFPSKWERRVLEAADAAGVPPMARQRIVDKLRAKKDFALFRNGRVYDPDLPTWIENAIASNAEEPFHAILVAETHDGDNCICTNDLDDTHPLFGVPRTADVPRTAIALASACSVLLQAAREVDIVDPYLFNIMHSSRGYRETIRHLLGVLSDTSSDSNLTVRLHYGNIAGTCPSQVDVMENAGAWFRGLIPPSITVHFIAWDKRPRGEDFHDRFVLTNRGGLQIGSGLGAVGSHRHALITLLDTQYAQDMRERFSAHADVYDQHGRTVAISSTGEVQAL